MKKKKEICEKWLIAILIVLILSVSANIVFIFLLETNKSHQLKENLRKPGVFSNYEPKINTYKISANNPVVYFAHLSEIKYVFPINKYENYSMLPDQLVISPGFYKFGDDIYDLNNEGLYRFIIPEKTNEQRIVFSKDITSLLSGIAWIVTHGYSDNNKSIEDIVIKATKSKLFLTCTQASKWAFELLQKLNIRSRIVAGLTLDEWNSYDNGHTLIEVFNSELQKWILYDLDNNCIFVKKDIPLSLVEFSDAVFSDDYQIKKIADDARFDVSNIVRQNNFDFAFLSEFHLRTEKLRTWYKRVMQAPLIQDENFQYFYINGSQKSRIESYSSNYRYMSREDFMKRFYLE